MFALPASALAILATVTCMNVATYTNPVAPGDFPDPFIIQHGDTFYAYATHNSPAGFQFRTSKDLVNWETQPAVYLPPWSNNHLWAPEVFQWKGRWFFFYSALDHEDRKRDLAVAVGDSPAGPFQHLAKLVLGKDMNPGTDENGVIDPHIFVEDGVPYMLYIREAPPRSLNIVRLSDDLSRTVGEHKPLLFADRPIERGVLDAPTLFKRNGTYYLFYSSGWFHSYKRDASYQVWVATSNSLMGPCTKPERPILTTRPGEVYLPGHQHVFQTANGDWWIAYHAWNADREPHYAHNRYGRTLRLDRLIWTAEGPQPLVPSTTPQPVPVVTSPAR